MALGPFGFSLPVEGLTEKNLPAVKKILNDRFGHAIMGVGAENGTLHFYAGADSPKSLLRLSEIREALQAAGLTVKSDQWTLKAQEIGLCLSAEETLPASEVKEAIESFPGVKTQVLGSILDGSSLCLVVHLEGEADYNDLREWLERKGLQIDDLMWGHWKYGWKISGDAPHRHDTGMRRKTPGQ